MSESCHLGCRRAQCLGSAPMWRAADRAAGRTVDRAAAAQQPAPMLPLVLALERARAAMQKLALVQQPPQVHHLRRVPKHRRRQRTLALAHALVPALMRPTGATRRLEQVQQQWVQRPALQLQQGPERRHRLWGLMMALALALALAQAMENLCLIVAWRCGCQRVACLQACLLACGGRPRRPLFNLPLALADARR